MIYHLAKIYPGLKGWRCEVSFKNDHLMKLAETEEAAIREARVFIKILNCQRHDPARRRGTR